MMEFGEHLRLVDGQTTCAKCGHALGPCTQNFKLGAKFSHRLLTELSDLNVDPQLLIDDEIVLREYYCPGCGGLLSNEITKPADPPRHDFMIDLAES